MADSLQPRPGQGARWLLWLACLGAWTVALLVPQPIQPGTGLRDPDFLFTTAKLLHVLAYAALAGLGTWFAVSIRQYVLVPGTLIVHACVTEWLQWSLPELGRFGTVRDALLDCLGIGLGMGLVVIRKWRRGAERKNKPAGQEAGPPVIEESTSAQ